MSLPFKHQEPGFDAGGAQRGVEAFRLMGMHQFVKLPVEDEKRRTLCIDIIER